MSLTQMVRDLFNNHPDIRVSDVGHTVHAERFITTNGAPLAFEPRRVRFQNIFARADSFDPAAVAHIEKKLFPVRAFSKSKPNHNLFGEKAFKEVDLVRFRIHELSDAQCVVDAVVKGRS